MPAEIVTIGDELLSGQTVDTNAAFIGEKLMAAGIPVRWRTTVGDAEADIAEALERAHKRAEVVIATGGLGPTHDDVTKKAIVQVFRRSLVFHDDVLKKVQALFSRRGLEMPKINQNQALLPQGTKIIDNPVGTAVGIWLEEDGRVFVALPGVPAEMRPMLLEGVLPLLRQEGRRFLLQRKLRTTGIPESALYERLAAKIAGEGEIRVAFLPGFLGVDIRLSLLTANREHGQRQLETFVEALRPLIGPVLYGVDAETLEKVVGQLLAERKLTLAVAESCTGGMLGERITNISGSSKYFDRGVVTYSNQAKMDLLGVPAILIEKHGAVSAEVAGAMAEGVRRAARTDFGLSITGIAGPAGGTAEKPVGLIYIGLAASSQTITRRFIFGTERDLNRQRASQAALDLLRLYLLNEETA